MKKLTLVLIMAVLLAGCAEEASFRDASILREMKDELDPARIGSGEGRELWASYESYLQNREIVVSAVGDIMLGRRVGRLLDENGGESAYQGFSFLFDRSDVLFGNLECSLSERGQKLLGKGIWLRATPDKADILKEAGFSVLSLANNHILDYGNEALLDTVEFLDEKEIGHVGAGKDIEAARKPEIFTKGDVSIGFLAYNEFSYYFWSYEEKRQFAASENVPGTTPMDLGPILEDVEKLKREVDLVAVSLHWGIEESNMETEAQREIAHALIDGGADMIIGHHPHVIQGLEIYRDKPIIYSLGNYIFDQNDENNKQGMAAEIEIFEGGMKSIRLHPLYVKDKRAPVVPEGGKLEGMIEKIKRLSGAMGTELESEGDHLIYLFGPPQ
ncbi:MAG: hypothetical protein C0604_07530 [Clostridiales bacterium]|nr:MAG: hypothetical protein C0604_07530 [Clostridiales bacterium]